jgi:hypothetical protein
VTVALTRAADKISGAQNEQTLALQQTVPWASPTLLEQGFFTVVACSTDAASFDHDAADAV